MSELHNGLDPLHPPQHGGRVLLADASPEGEAIGTALRGRGFDIVEVPLLDLAARVESDAPRVVIVSIDQQGLIEALEDVHARAGSALVTVLLIGDPVLSTELDPQLFGQVFERPVDIVELAAHVSSVIEPAWPRMLRVTAPPSFAGPRPLTGYPGPLDSEAPSATDFPSELELDMRSIMPAADDGEALASRFMPARLSPELEQLLAAAEQRVTAKAHPSSVPSAEEDVDLILSPELLSALDEPLDPDEDDARTGATAAGTLLHASSASRQKTSTGLQAGAAPPSPAGELGSRAEPQPAHDGIGSLSDPGDLDYEQPLQEAAYAPRWTATEHDVASPAPRLEETRWRTDPAHAALGSTIGASGRHSTPSANLPVEASARWRETERERLPLTPRDLPRSRGPSPREEPERTLRAPSEPPARGERSRRALSEPPARGEAARTRRAFVDPPFDAAPEELMDDRVDRQNEAPPLEPMDRKRHTEPPPTRSRGTRDHGVPGIPLPSVVGVGLSPPSSVEVRTAMPPPAIRPTALESARAMVPTPVAGAFVRPPAPVAPPPSTAGGPGRVPPPLAPPPAANAVYDEAPLSSASSATVLGPGDAPRALARAVGSRASGSLAITTEQGTRRIVLHDGDLVTAGTGVPEETLLAFLVGRGDIARATAVRLQGKLPASGRHAGAALIAHGHLGQDDLWPVLRAHAEWVIGHVVLVESGTCDLEPEPPGRLKAEPNVFGGATGAEVFVETVRRVIAPEIALRRLGGVGARLDDGHRRNLLAECALPREEEQLVRSARGRAVGDIVETVDPEIASVLYALVCLEVLDVLIPPSITEAPPAPTEDPLDEEAIRQRVRARLALVEDGDYFSILGISRDATNYEIRRAYLALRKAFEPSNLLTAATVDLVEDVRLVIEVLDEAYEILREPHRRERYRRAIEAGPP